MRILLVEDNEGDIFLFKETVRDLGYSIELFVSKNGAAAWEFLQKNHVHLVLLDINLPLMNGFELLERIKSDESLRGTPVVCLSTSSHAPDLQKAYHLHANGFFSKPDDTQGFEQLCNIILPYWEFAIPRFE